MKIIPAIDLLDGEVVRLFKGDYEEKNVYGKNPLEQAILFAEAGFDHLHIVDLNGAKTGRFENLPHIKRIIDTLGISVQTGGGVRTREDLERLLHAGVSKVICSSMAVKNRNDWIASLQAYPEQCILGMDLKDGKMAYGGWLETTGDSIADFLKPMVESGLKEVLCTDIARDGTLEGPNVELYKELMLQFPDLKWIASGGVSGPGDLQQLRKTGVSAVVVGKAYYEGRITLNQLKEQ